MSELRFGFDCTAREAHEMKMFCFFIHFIAWFTYDTDSVRGTRMDVMLHVNTS